MKITFQRRLHTRGGGTFFGLPDLKPTQTELLDQLKDRLSKSMQALRVL